MAKTIKNDLQYTIRAVDVKEIDGQFIYHSQSVKVYVESIHENINMIQLRANIKNSEFFFTGKETFHNEPFNHFFGPFKCEESAKDFARLLDKAVDVFVSRETAWRVYEFNPKNE